MGAAPGLPQGFPSPESLLPEELPELRDDIVIEYGGVDFNGSLTYVIYDCLNNRFFHIDWQTYEVLKHWGAISPEELFKRLAEKSLVSIDPMRLSNILTFLSNQCLIKQGYQRLSQIFQMQQEKKKTNAFMWLAKNYLFFRVPLVRPNYWLTITYPYVAFIFRKTFFFFILFLAITGIAVVSKQWDTFKGTFFDVFEIRYLIVFGIALIIAKVFHELGHAYNCKRYGLNVPTMGIAFLVMWPMLYTDTSESWRVRSAKERIRISIAGVQMEIYIAIFALWVWILSAPGVIHSIAFFLCTYSLIATIILNIGPFLRFDGYHILSDILTMRNLQTRSFALTKWWLREKIFGFKFDPPEVFSKNKTYVLMIYAWSNWLYRFFLFLGIALLVYHLFFKVLGIILFLIEIVYFLAMPIAKEFIAWWKLREHMTLNRNTITSLLILLFIIGLLAIPWRKEIAIPATFSYKTQSVYATEPAYVGEVLVKRGDRVEIDQPLIVLESPKLNFHIEKTKYKIAEVNWQLQQIAGDREELDLQQIYLSQLNHEKTQLNAYEERKDRLVIKAPFSGKIVDILSNLAVGRWIRNKQLLIEVVNPNQYVINAYVSEDYKHKLKSGQMGRFVPDNIDQSSFEVKLDSIAYQQIKSFNLLDQFHTKEGDQINQNINLSGYHISSLGGAVAVRMSEENSNQFISEESQYNVKFVMIDTNNQNYTINQVERGRIFISVDRESILAYLFRRVAAFFIKESSF